METVFDDARSPHLSMFTMFRSFECSRKFLPAVRICRLGVCLPVCVAATLLLGGCTNRGGNEDKPSAEKMLEELGASTSSQGEQAKGQPETVNDVTKSNRASEISLPIPSESTVGSQKGLESNQGPDSKILGSDVVLKEKKIIPITVDDPSAEWSGELVLPYQVWEMTFVGNAPAGYTSRRVFAPNNRDRRLKIELESTVHVQRAGKLVRQRLEVKSTELTNGELVSVSGSLVSGDIKREFFAVNSSGVLTVEATTDGAKTRTEIKIDDKVRGPFAVEQSLIRKPLRAGEIRSIRYFDPMVGKVVEANVEGLELTNSATMLGKSMELLKISMSMRDGNLTANSTLWMSPDGRVVKTNFPKLNLRVFQVEEKLANEFSKTSDLQFVPSIDCPLELNSNGDVYTAALNQNDTVLYRLSHVTEDPTQIISKKTNQRVRSVPAARACEIATFRINKEKELPVGIDREINPPKAAKLSSDWCDTESSLATEFFTDFTSGLSEEASKDGFLVVEHLRQAILQKFETVEFDREIRKFHQLVRAKNLDGFEHALLLATMCRKSGIPARIAIGIVYNQDDAKPQMRLHGWVEYFVKDRWYPTDSSQSSAKAELDRIKIRESYADSALFLEDVLYVANWINNVKIRFVP